MFDLISGWLFPAHTDAKAVALFLFHSSISFINLSPSCSQSRSCVLRVFLPVGDELVQQSARSHSAAITATTTAHARTHTHWLH